MPEDVRRSMHVIEQDRMIFSPDSWPRVPATLEDLVIRERILLCVFEEIQSGRIVCAGGSGFLQPDFFQSAFAAGEGLVNAAFDCESRGRAAFLNRKQIADGNRREDLRLLNFFGIPKVDLEQPETLEILGVITEGWTFFHKGFGLRELWNEVAEPFKVKVLLRLGAKIQQTRTLASGMSGVLFCITREMALESTPAWPGSAMLSGRPRFGFKWREQQLLELALLDHSDRDAASHLQVSAEAVKKRWRSIYTKVSRADPSLLPVDLSGADQRRFLLQGLRNNLQELRPY